MTIDYLKRVTHVSLVLLAFVASSGAFNLTWQEEVRLFVINGGLIYLFLRHKHKLSSCESDDGQQKLCHYGSILLSVVFMFIITQFDPSTSAIHHFFPYQRLNYFFLSFSGLILVAWIVYVVSKFRNEQSRYLRESTFDKYVLGVGGAVIGVSIIPKVAISETHFRLDDIIGIFKIIEYIVLYFIVTGLYTHALPLKAHSTERFLTKIFSPTLQGLFLSIIFTFSTVLAIGLYRFSTAVYDRRSGIALLEKGHYDEALQKLETASKKLNHSSASLYLDIGKAYVETGNLKTAQDMFGRSLGLSLSVKDKNDTRKRIGDIYAGANLWDDAVREYEAIKNVDKNHPGISNALALAYLKGGQQESFTDLLKEIQDVSKIKADNATECCMLGFALIENSRWDQAISPFRKAVEIEPGNQKGYYGLGVVLNHAQRWDESSAYLQKALTVGPASAEVYMALGEAYTGQGRLRKAIEYYEKALEYDPSYVYALGGLRDLHRQAGQEGLAADLVKRMQVRILASEWKGIAGGNLAWSGNCFKKIDLYKGDVDISVDAMGSGTRQVWPHMVVYLDDKQVGQADVNPAGSTYRFSTTIKDSRRYRLSVAFTNDALVEGVDINLYVGDAVIRYK
jgi:tetratricopeptide (TPR) repeat protein